MTTLNCDKILMKNNTSSKKFQKVI